MDLNTFIWSASTEEETIECIERLSNILDDIGGESQGKTETIENTDILGKEKDETGKNAIKTDVTSKDTECKKEGKEEKKEDVKIEPNENETN